VPNRPSGEDDVGVKYFLDIVALPVCVLCVVYHSLLVLPGAALRCAALNRILQRFLAESHLPALRKGSAGSAGQKKGAGIAALEDKDKVSCTLAAGSARARWVKEGSSSRFGAEQDTKG
jgi:hypothetical protein